MLAKESETASATTVEALALSVEDLARRVPISRNQIYAEIAAGRLQASKVGRKLVITPAAVSAWLKALEAAP